MRKNSPFKPALKFLFLSLLLASCESGPRVQMAPGYETTPTRQEVQANLMGTPEPTPIPPTPTPKPLVLDDTFYSLPSNAFRLQTPQGWLLISEDTDYVRFESSNQKAWFEAAVESSGYPLPQEDLETYMENMLVSLYRGVGSFELLEKQVDEGQATYISTFQKDDLTWIAQDVFIQREHAIYALSFQALDMVWEAYQPGFQAVVDSLETKTGYVTDEMIYTFRHSYKAPNNQFGLEIPLGWTSATGQDTVEGAVFDEISAPDGQASVEIVAYDGEEDLKTLDIGQVAIGIIKDLDGRDLRSRDASPLNDGRIRLDWQIDSKDMSGFSFFWQDNNIVYILTFKYYNQSSGVYQNVLYTIGDSFNLS